MILLDGKKIAMRLQEDIAQKVAKIEGRKPSLAFVLVGNHPPSQAYVRAKKKACAATGITSTLLELPASVSLSHLLHSIEELNRDAEIDGILVQLPLPPHIKEKVILFAMDPNKDVDGFHPFNLGRLLLGDEEGFIPCTPRGIQVLLHESEISVAGKRVVIVGRSHIVGKPLAALLMQKGVHGNATVTVAHTQSKDLPEITRSAEILIAALGCPHFIKQEMVRPGSVVIDVGINRLSNGKITGDVDFAAVSRVASHITPVPGGVGPMTIAMLLQNTLLAYHKNQPVC